ncbi:PP2C family protein-serine/threonine phosphatase [Paenibacillus turpanensis]|uniref:PP2C family protein-serine/threonine phosphatase n=1 Tax=Paenibacillus turpanensis TaxID=2689078 RepID=UPI00140C7823|nr:protein phosphatase 2C domain-containing protein [Paenibacillus turpanensis]
MRKDNSEFKTSFLSEAGTFLDNKDYFAYAEMDDLACWVLADGLDAAPDADSARLAVESVLSRFTEQPTLSRRKLKSYLRKAHKRLQAESRKVRLKCSLVMVVTDYNQMVWASVGHARLYMLRGGKIALASKDQSLAQRLADIGKLQQQDVDRHAERGNLLHYMGKPGAFRPQVSGKVKLQDGDTMLLCTHGLWEGVHPVELLDAREEADEPEQLIDMLEEILLSKQRKTVNNYTGVAIFANKIYKVEPKKRDIKKWVRTAAMILIPMLLFGGGAVYYKIKSAEVKAETVAAMIEHEQNGDKEMEEGDYGSALKEYSEARIASNRLKNKVQTKLISDKQNVADLVVAGDKFFKEGEYEKAVERYQKSLEEAKPYKSFNMSGVEESIKKAQTYLVILGVMKQGDVKFEAKDYAGARQLYEEAQKQATMAAFEQGGQQISAKIAAVDKELVQVKVGEQQAKGEETEKQGDKQLEAQEFAKAIATYTIAQNMYKEAGLTDKVLSVQYKMIEAQEQLDLKKVPPPAEGAPEGHAVPAAAGQAG